jgi:uncharacterized membrane protein
MKKMLQAMVLTGLMLIVCGALNPISAEAHGGGGMGGGTSHSGGGMSNSGGMHRGGYINPWLLYPLPSQTRKPRYLTGPFSGFRH